MNGLDGLILKLKECNCEFLTDEPLSKYTTFKVGGKCSLIVNVDGIETVKMVVDECKQSSLSYFVIGKGSNLIALDSGYSGVIIRLGKAFSELVVDEDCSIVCLAGASLSDICKLALNHQLTGAEFAWGIPGSIGGAIYMNAGAYGGEISQIIEWVEFLDSNGEIKRFNAEQSKFSYRSSAFMGTDLIILRCKIRLLKGNADKIKARMDELILQRTTKQPLNYPSAGSTFKRPNGSYASLLIEQCGLKGLSVGGAEVSRKHSGFVINKGNATCEDILELVEQVKDKVQKETGYILELEPRIIGD